MAGRNHFESEWMALSLLFLCFTSYYSAVEGMHCYGVVASYTTEIIEVEEGEKFLIPCKINSNIDIVYWRTYTAPYDYYLVKLDLSVSPPLRYGQGYEAGLFNITDDFSLVINNVRPEDENGYKCFMRDYGNSILYHNTTFVSVRQKGSLQRTTSASPSPVDIPSMLQESHASELHTSTLSPVITPTTQLPIVGIPNRNTSAKLSTVNAPSTPKAVNASGIHTSTEFTPTTECPPNVVFKVLSVVSVAALAVSWALVPCLLLLKQRRRAIKAVPPVDPVL